MAVTFDTTNTLKYFGRASINLPLLGPSGEGSILIAAKIVTHTSGNHQYILGVGNDSPPMSMWVGANGDLVLVQDDTSFAAQAGLLGASIGSAREYLFCISNSGGASTVLTTVDMTSGTLLSSVDRVLTFPSVITDMYIGNRKNGSRVLRLGSGLNYCAVFNKYVYPDEVLEMATGVREVATQPGISHLFQFVSSTQTDVASNIDPTYSLPPLGGGNWGLDYSPLYPASVNPVQSNVSTLHRAVSRLQEITQVYRQGDALGTPKPGTDTGAEFNIRVDAATKSISTLTGLIS